MSIVLDTPKTIEVSDMGLMAALMVKGHKPIERIIRDKQVLFVFEDLPDTREIKRKYFTGELEVNAFEFNEQLKTLKKTIYHILKNA